MKTSFNNISSGVLKIKVNPNMKDHSNDPYIVKKADHAAKMVAKYGLPAELVKLQAERLKG
jgi:hypothetical protein